MARDLQKAGNNFISPALPAYKADLFSVDTVDAVFLLAHGSVYVEIHGSPYRRVAQDGGHGLAVYPVLQTCRGETVAHGVEIAVLHFAALQDRLEAFLDIPRFRAGAPPGQHIEVIPFAQPLQGVAL